MWRIPGRRRRWLVRLAVGLAVLTGASWVWLGALSGPSYQFALLRGTALAVVRWANANLLSIQSISLIVALGGLATAVIVPIWIALRQREWNQLDKAAEQRRIRDRKLMLRRVYNKWIRDVYDPSLADAVEINISFKPWRSIEQTGVANLRPRPVATELFAAFEETAGALLILGAPGSGKTTALLRLTRILINRAEADNDQPIPVVFLLSSWASRRLPLQEWLVHELGRSYDVPRRTALEWVRGNQILPLLDGLDEIVEPYRVDCVNAISDFQRTYGLTQFVACSRTDDYATLPSQLQIAAVELQPLTRRQVSGYLRRKSLVSVRNALRADGLLNDLLQRPLVLRILVHTFETGAIPSLAPSGTPEDLLTRLFEAYADRMLRHRTGLYTSQQKRRWLAWLARSMSDHRQTEFHLDRLQPDWLPASARRAAVVLTAISAGLLAGLADGLIVALVYDPSRGLINGAAIGLFFALFAGLGRKGAVDGVVWSIRRVRTGALGGLLLGASLWLLSSPIDGILFGLFFLFMFSVFAGLKKAEPVEQLLWSWRRASVGLLGGAALGVIPGLIYALAYGLASDLASSLAFSAVFGLTIGVFGGLVNGMVPGLADRRARPNEGIHRSARVALVTSSMSSLLVGSAVGLTFEFVLKVPNGLGAGIRNGLVLGVAVGMLAGGLACLQHVVLRGILAYLRVAPLSYVRFLDDAAAQMMLRRTGSGYIFVHGLLLELFAKLNPDRQSGSIRR